LLREQLEHQYVLGLEGGYTDDGYRDGREKGDAEGFDEGLKQAAQEETEESD
jgi:hypothetical protein